MKKPVALDLCCGLGGWAEGLIETGWEVWGFDISERFRAVYPGDRFYCCDVRLATAYLGDLGNPKRIKLVVASPPCEEYSRHDMPWTRARNPPCPDKSIWHACEYIAMELGVPLIIENVRGAQRFHGPAVWHVGPYYLWGDVPALMPKDIRYRKKESMPSSAVAERAKVPVDLSKYIGCIFKQ